jgi:pimeloyl-ACP methyl ester carboxylesterase
MKSMLEVKNASEEETYKFFQELGPNLGEARWRDQTRRLRNTADGPFEILNEWAESGGAPDIIETVRKIKCPALLMQADTDVGGVLPDDLARQAVENLRNGELQTFPGVGHSIHKDDPAAFASSALNFLRQHR